jgi:predicted 3-demethylubiquinone-9 3-methyltransferase (glyoxalase superfamily)
MQKLTTFLMFNKGAHEAMKFYTSVFKDGKITGTMPGPSGEPVGGTFEIMGQEIKCYNGGSHFSFSEGTSLFINAETQDEIDHYYEKLSDGGEQQPCGWLKDKFGVSWQVVPPVLLELLNDPDREKANRVMNAMLGMKKLDIAALEAAAA